MSIYFFSPEQCERHEMEAGHPESPARLNAIKNALKKAGIWEHLSHQSAAPATREQLAAGHTSAYIQTIFENAPSSDYYLLDPDTSMNAHSLSAARLATGTALTALDQIFAQPNPSQAFCNVRPPGHHAESGKAMGFCLFNTVAIAAKYAKQQFKLNRIAIVDFDVHHGNGTEDIVANDDSIILLSTFQSPLYPYSGVPASAPNIHNYPMDAFTDSKSVRLLWEQHILPLLNAYRPELILVSAGFDAHQDDPLAQLNFADDDYAFFAFHLKKIAQQYAQGRLVACLEGGYQLTALGNSVARFIQELLD